MKNQALFSSKDKVEKLKCRLLQFLFGAFKVKIGSHEYFSANREPLSLSFAETVICFICTSIRLMVELTLQLPINHLL